MARDREAADWAEGLLKQTIERREQRVQAIAPYVYPFTTGSDGVAQYPTSPLLAGNPPSEQAILRQLEEIDPLFAYLYLMPGVPTPPSVWQGPSFTDQNRADIPLGVPSEIIEEGEFDFYLFGAFVSPTLKRTFCIPLKGDTFGKLQVVSGLYGGVFSSLQSIGEEA